MINVSNEWKRIVADNVENETAPDFTAKVTITLADSTVLNITEEDIVAKGLKFNDSTSPNSSFQTGTAIINQCSLMLNNIGGKFNQYDFTDAEIRPYVGLRLSEATEWIKKGVFTVDEPTVASSIVSLVCLDNMNKFDTPFSGVVATFPISAFNLLYAVCSYSGVSLSTVDFTNKGYIIGRRPSDEAITCREIVAWIAQISGNFARCNKDGALELKWYDIGAFEQSDNIDGGKFDGATPYASGDSADGGNFTDYSSGDNIDGGTFLQMERYHHIYALSQATIGTDDVVITGIQVKAMGTESDYGETVLFGSNGYAIEITDNPLITEGNASIIANSVGAKLVGMRFRTCSVSAISDPSREAGDVAMLSDNKGNSYQILLTNISSQIGSNDNISCDAETPSKKQSVRFDPNTKMIIEARKMVQQKINAYDLAVQQLNGIMANAMGFYETFEPQEDGSKIEYMHDKPTLEESVIIYKKSISGFAVSTNGGTTWSSGFTADGNIIAKTLAVIGINAEWIKVLTSFTVGTKFSVDALGNMITKSGTIGRFVFDVSGLKSQAMQLLDNDINPLIWLKSLDGSEQANYEGRLVSIRSSNGTQRQTALIDTRFGYLHGLEFVKEDIESNFDLGGIETGKARFEMEGLSSDAVVFTLDLAGVMGSFSPFGISIQDPAGNMIYTDENGIVIQSTSGSSISMGFNYLAINSAPGGTTLIDGEDIKSMKDNLTQAMNDIALIKTRLNIT